MIINPKSGILIHLVDAEEILGIPNVMLGDEYVFVVVDTRPDSVTVIVTTDGGGKIVGSAEIFSSDVACLKRGLYVVFARPVATTPPNTVVTEVLNA